MDRGGLLAILDGAVGEIDAAALPAGAKLSRGKVRDVVDLGSELLIATTDRISAFDRVLATIPCKGEVLNTLSLFWFAGTADIIANHVVEEVSPRTVRALKCEVVPLEIVVRGYLTGSAWRDYEKGASVSGIALPPGLHRNQRFQAPLITPSTKEEKGKHDRPISRQEIVSGSLVPRALWERIEEAALALFRRGTETAAARGLILVDTKYEFGLKDGVLRLIDEVHTPDSSRYWYADTYDSLFAAGGNQRELDKEYLRQWLLERGFSGDGPAPAIPDEVRVEVAWKYVTAWQTITGKPFSPRSLPALEEARRIGDLVRRRAAGK